MVKEAVEEKLDDIDRSRLGSKVAGESYVLARNGDVSAVGIRFLGQNVQTTLEKEIPARRSRVMSSYHMA